MPARAGRTGTEWDSSHCTMGLALNLRGEPDDPQSAGGTRLGVDTNVGDSGCAGDRCAQSTEEGKEERENKGGLDAARSSTVGRLILLNDARFSPQPWTHSTHRTVQQPARPPTMPTTPSLPYASLPSQPLAASPTNLSLPQQGLQSILGPLYARGASEEEIQEVTRRAYTFYSQSFVPPLLSSLLL